MAVKGDMSQLPLLTCGMAGLFGISAFLDYYSDYISDFLAHTIIQKIRNNTYKVILNEDMQFHDTTHTGELTSRMGSDIQELGLLLGNYFGTGIISLVQTIGSLGLMLYISPTLTGYILLLLSPITVITYYNGRRVKKLSRTIKDNLAQMNICVEEKVGNIRTVKWFNQERREYLDYKAKNKLLFDNDNKRARIRAAFGAGGNMIVGGALTGGQLASFAMYTMSVSSGITATMKALGASQRVFELTANPFVPTKGSGLDRYYSERNHTTDMAITAQETLKGEIQLKDVSFAYPQEPHHLVLQNINIIAHPGENIGIVGGSGSGKSTISSLVGGLYKVTQGEVLLDGINLNNLAGDFIRSVPQEPVLFSGTIRSNIVYGSEHVSEERVKEVVNQMHIDDFTRFMPNGLDTYRWRSNVIDSTVGERGVGISGGQKQRIAIARSLLRDPKVIIMDEPTSALDGENETLIINTIYSNVNKNHDKTIIMITHRRESIIHCDRLYVLNQGKLIEEGTFDELMRKRGYFYNLFNTALSCICYYKQNIG
ncbi:ATP-binding cassette sub-family b member mitochondrial [Blastocystis sp. subtype 4]|uniref:ATP-binding cassette sub-family b member mitochondrial n=1 Tax=Blastocystis sp. subtype 4 TaxID=944170 RepID=UPI0007113551|nr:ATP-binding cassette sub-family b member mitochondrial [Blastocystis sp. subtype 4]KNB44168.1 ATP-binding cassette sub-family b member mitochondrial [Blastocystis sp. subtype 4]|eukprot:XP_014527611.1 ATP-binding cassette sub-family b member mitochondrial [Blastocystis sp. subtype 4]